jgi:hypothetical protein
MAFNVQEPIIFGLLTFLDFQQSNIKRNTAFHKVNLCLSSGDTVGGTHIR